MGLESRYLHINATKEWGRQPNLQIGNGGVKSSNGGVNAEEILQKMIAENPGCNAPSLSRLLQKSLRTIQRQLKSLTDKGKIEFRGVPKTGGYWAID